ncbi:uncharacterized protein MELLADRAFT_64441 [Melampsora larici-populina 98AG31]|uniref:Uncharacterized protein n=1 Tax=Melampsora larici-populina (strain 98AG31 / pathotype 3-4-7) TaxID=747676 RepID=F4RRG1_MELLP|nr:uncharacterized protein MELLADRAFT_64441 [Melampsora larici-populina 98AG31]EGG05040.1 hypothetical protein MELLADRAFT_64441 [Melampsora larici-populina 98AG31]
MHLNFISKKGIDRHLVHGISFTLGLILFSTNKQAWSLEVMFQTSSENLTKEDHRIHAFEVPSFHTGSEHASIDFSPSIHPEVYGVLEHEELPYGEIDANLLQNPTAYLENIESNQASIHELTANKNLGSIECKTGSHQEATLGLPFHDHDTNWSQMWYDSVIDDNSLEEMFCKPSNSPIMSMDSFTKYNPQVHEYKSMSHLPIHMPHQSFEHPGYRSEGSNISCDTADNIMREFPNYNHLVSENQSLKHTPSNLNHEVVLLPGPHSRLTKVFQDNKYQVNGQIPSYKQTAHKMNYSYGVPQSKCILNCSPELGDHPAQEAQVFNKNAIGRGSECSTSLISNNMDIPESILEHIELPPFTHDNHIPYSQKNLFSEIMSPTDFTRNPGAPESLEKCEYKNYVPIISEHQIPQKGNSEVENPQLKGILKEMYTLLDHHSDKSQIFREKPNGGEIGGSYFLDSKNKPGESESISAYGNLTPYISAHNIPHSPNYIDIFSATGVPNYLTSNSNQIMTPRIGTELDLTGFFGKDNSNIISPNPLQDQMVQSLEFKIPQHRKELEGSSAVFDHHLYEPQGSNEKTNGWGSEGYENQFDDPHKEKDIGKITLRKLAGNPTQIQSSRDIHMGVDNLIEVQEEYSGKAQKSLKRKASSIVTMRLDEEQKKICRESAQDYADDPSYESRLIKFVNMHSDSSDRRGGISRRDMIQVIQDVGMKSIQSCEELYLQNQTWFKKWKGRLVQIIRGTYNPGNPSKLSARQLLNALKKVNDGVVMGFLGLLNLIESHIEVNSAGENILHEGLEFIENYVNDMSSLIIQNLPCLPKISEIDISSDPLEVFLSVTQANRRGDLYIELYHNIWTKWKAQKAPLTPHVSLGAFRKVLYRLTLPHRKVEQTSSSGSKKNPKTGRASYDAKAYQIKHHIVMKGKSCMDFFNHIFKDKAIFFQGLEVDLLNKLIIEQKNIPSEAFINCQRCLTNAIKVVKLNVVEGFFGVIKCLNEIKNSEWNIQPILINGWNFLKQHFSSWKSIPLENLFLEAGLSKFGTHQKLSPEMKFVAKSFHTVMRASYKNVISARLVQSLLINWTHSFDTNQSDFKILQKLLRSRDATPLIHWF